MNGVVNETINGVSTPSYSGNTLKFGTSHREFRSISVVNTDGAESLKYVITGYFDANEKAWKILRSENTLATTEIFNLMVNTNLYHHVIVTIKSATAAIACDYSVILNMR